MIGEIDGGWRERYEEGRVGWDSDDRRRKRRRRVRVKETVNTWETFLALRVCACFLYRLR